MTGAASTVQQIVLLVLFVLPGISYQFVRERLRGPVPGERDLSERVLRAITASITLDAIYVLVAGPWIVHLIKPAHRGWFSSTVDNPRQQAALALLLFIIVPTAAAWGVSLVERRRRPARFNPVPAAWDMMFRGRTTGFVRARMKSGAWVGGWYGKQGSHASAYPNPADLYLESAYEMSSDGSFGARVRNTGGLYLRMDDVEVLEFVESPSSTRVTGRAESLKEEGEA
jgi:Family of unknown function (DUF6338)